MKLSTKCWTILWEARSIVRFNSHEQSELTSFLTSFYNFLSLFSAAKLAIKQDLCKRKGKKFLDYFKTAPVSSVFRNLELRLSARRASEKHHVWICPNPREDFAKSTCELCRLHAYSLKGRRIKQIGVKLCTGQTPMCVV